MTKHTHTDSVWTIDRFWTPQQCVAFIEKSEQIGYEPAAIETEKGQMVVEHVRNNNRVIFTDRELASVIWKDVSPFVPSSIGNSKAIGLNEMFRFYRYTSGQQFRKHRDQSYIRNETEASYYTFMIYLNEDYKGGETTFDKLVIQPKTGSALIFLHSLEHSGEEVISGIKYVLRTDIMYKLEEFV